MTQCCRAIALCFGYVESNTTSHLVYQADHKWPSSRKEALHSLVNYLYNKFVYENEDYRKSKMHMADCCRKGWWARDRENPPTNCPTCNADYNVPFQFSEEEWINYLYDLHRSNCDSYGDHDDIDNPYDWQPWRFYFDVPQHEMLIISENAEHILTHALYEIRPELKDKSKSELLYKSYLYDDYSEMLDENNSFGDHGYSKNEYSSFKETKIHEYPNGAVATITDGRYTHIKYNTGDAVWFRFQDGKYFVKLIYTNDDKLFNYLNEEVK